MQSLIRKYSIFSDNENIHIYYFWKVFLKNWIIKLCFHLPSKFVFIYSKKNPGVTDAFFCKLIVLWNKKWKDIIDNCFIKMSRLITIEGSFSDPPNLWFWFEWSVLLHCLPILAWLVQNKVGKTVLLWGISCRFNIHRALT